MDLDYRAFYLPEESVSICIINNFTGLKDQNFYKFVLFHKCE